MTSYGGAVYDPFELIRSLVVRRFGQQEMLSQSITSVYIAFINLAVTFDAQTRQDIKDYIIHRHVKMWLIETLDYFQ